MRYILVMISGETVWQNLTPEQAQAFDDRLTVFNNELRTTGAWVSGEGLQEQASAKTVRLGAGTPTVTDGPYSDAAEQLAGFWIIEAGSLEEAVEWGRKAPMDEGAIEVRPLVAE